MFNLSAIVLTSSRKGVQLCRECLDAIGKRKVRLVVLGRAMKFFLSQFYRWGRLFGKKGTDFRGSMERQGKR